MLRGHDRRRGTSLIGRSAGGNAADARDLRRDDRHMGGGQEWILSTGHIAANRVHRDVLVAKNDTGQSLDIKIAQRRLLVLGEILNLRLRELDIADISRRQLAQTVLDLAVRELGRESCRERVCTYVYISVVAV